MSHLPAPDQTAVSTTREWIEVVGYCDTRVLNVTTTLNASYTQPAVDGVVTLTVGSSTAIVPGDMVSVSGSLAAYRGGFYKVLSKPSSTSITVQLVGDGIAPGGTVSSGAAVITITPILVTPRNRGNLVITDIYADSLTCPGFGDTTRCTVSVGWNRGGTPFSEFYAAQQLNFVSSLSSGTMATLLGASFVQPSIGGAVTVSLAAPAVYVSGSWNYPVGTFVRINRSGVFRVDSLTTTTTTANYVQPAVNASVVVSVASSADFSVGSYVWVSSASVEGVGAYLITATSPTSLTLQLTNLGSSFVPGVALAGTVLSGATVTHAQRLGLTLIEDSMLSAGQSVANANTVLKYDDAIRATVASYVRPVAGFTVDINVGDNRPYVVGTNVWIYSSFDVSDGIYSIQSKKGLNILTIQTGTAADFAAGATIPAGAIVSVRRPSGQVLPLRSTGTTRLSVQPGATVGAYVSVSSNATAASMVAIFLRGYYVS